jgi:hypothetical protein
MVLPKYQMILGHPLNHSTLLLPPLLTALPHRRPMTLFPPVGPMVVHVVLVQRGMALSGLIIITRDASALNTLF